MSEKRILALACDHAGYELKQVLKEELLKSGYIVEDFGCFSTESVDYPDFIHPLSQAVHNGVFPAGIILCGSGIGVSMVANKYANVRAALCCDAERARMARKHNDANVLAMGARYTSRESALEMMMAFLNTEFEGGRHLKRVNKIPPANSIQD